MPDTDKLNELRASLAEEREKRKRCEGVIGHLSKKYLRAATAYEYLTSQQEEGRKNVRIEYRDNGLLRVETGAIYET